MSYIAERRQEEKDRRRTRDRRCRRSALRRVRLGRGHDGPGGPARAPSRALLYVYFRDKEDLLLALVERSLDNLRERSSRRSADTPRNRRSRGHRPRLSGRSPAKSRTTSTPAPASRRIALAVPSRTPTKLACMAAGHRVHEVIVASLNRGIADGSVRNDLGDPYVTALSLWAFCHGVIQIASTKGGQIEHEGTPVPGFHRSRASASRCGRCEPEGGSRPRGVVPRGCRPCSRCQC